MTNDDVTLQIARDLVDSTNPLNVESLLDAVIAIYHDCNLPALKRIHNVAMFLTKCKFGVEFDVLDCRCCACGFNWCCL